MIYQICDVMMGDRLHFSVSHPEGISEHRFQLGILGGAANMTL